jgi:hypothetical protein
MSRLENVWVLDPGMCSGMYMRLLRAGPTVVLGDPAGEAREVTIAGTETEEVKGAVVTEDVVKVKEGVAEDLKVAVGDKLKAGTVVVACGCTAMFDTITTIVEAGVSVEDWAEDETKAVLKDEAGLVTIGRSSLVLLYGY